MEKAKKLFTDGGARGNPGPAAYAFVICKLDDTVVEKYGEYIGHTTNNQAEYKALIAGLSRVKTLGINTLQVFMDSELIIRQMQGKYKVKSVDLLPLYNEAKLLSEHFAHISFTHIARSLNAVADAEVNRILDQTTES